MLLLLPRVNQQCQSTERSLPLHTNSKWRYTQTLSPWTDCTIHNQHLSACSAILAHSVEDTYDHRHRIDKYLDTLLANQPISDGEATDHCQKGAPQDGRLPELIAARSCLTNHSEVASLWLVTPKQDVGNHQWRYVVCCNTEDLKISVRKTCAHQTLRLAAWHSG